MRVHQIAARLRTILGEKAISQQSSAVRDVVIIRVLASAVGYASMILLARWMGSSEYGLYSFAIAWMICSHIPRLWVYREPQYASLAQYAAANDWQHVVGFMKASSWLAFGCGALIATLAIAAVLLLQALSRSGVCRANDRRACRHSNRRTDHRQVRSDSGSRVAGACVGTSSTRTTSITPHYDRHHCILAMQLTATVAVCASILAYAANLIAQWGVLHARLGTRIRVEPKMISAHGSESPGPSCGSPWPV